MSAFVRMARKLALGWDMRWEGKKEGEGGRPKSYQRGVGGRERINASDLRLPSSFESAMASPKLSPARILRLRVATSPYH